MVVLVVGAIIVLNYGLQYTGSVFVLSACYAIVTAGMAVQIGFSQQIAFSQSVFFGVGAYGVAMLNTHYNMLGAAGHGDHGGRRRRWWRCCSARWSPAPPGSRWPWPR